MYIYIYICAFTYTFIYISFKTTLRIYSVLCYICTTYIKHIYNIYIYTYKIVGWGLQGNEPLVLCFLALRKNQRAEKPKEAVFCLHPRQWWGHKWDQWASLKYIGFRALLSLKRVSVQQGAENSHRSMQYSRPSHPVCAWGERVPWQRGSCFQCWSTKVKVEREIKGGDIIYLFIYLEPFSKLWQRGNFLQVTWELRNKNSCWRITFWEIPDGLRLVLRVICTF